MSFTLIVEFLYDFFNQFTSQVSQVASRLDWIGWYTVRCPQPVPPVGWLWASGWLLILILPHCHIHSLPRRFLSSPVYHHFHRFFHMCTEDYRLSLISISEACSGDTRFHLWCAHCRTLGCCVDPELWRDSSSPPLLECEFDHLQGISVLLLPDYNSAFGWLVFAPFSPWLILESPRLVWDDYL